MPDPDDYHQLRLSAGIPQSTYDSITPTVIAIVNQIDVMILILRGSDHKHARFACELGFALMLNKPIIAVVAPGVQLSDKLSRCIDSFVEARPDDSHMPALLEEARRLARP